MATTFINLKRGENKLAHFSTSGQNIGTVDTIYTASDTSTGHALLSTYQYVESMVNGEPWINKGNGVNQLWVDNTCINPHLDTTAWQVVQDDQIVWHGGIELGDHSVDPTTGEITRKIGIKLSEDDYNDLELRGNGLYLNVAGAGSDVENIVVVDVDGKTLSQNISGESGPTLSIVYNDNNNELTFSNGTTDFSVPVGGHTYTLSTNTSSSSEDTKISLTDDDSHLHGEITILGERDITVSSTTGTITITGPDLSHLTGAMHYRGVVSTTATVDGTGTWSWDGGAEPEEHEAGDVWVISVTPDIEHPEYYAKFPSGTGEKVETGDQILYTDATFNIVTGENQVEDKNQTLVWGNPTTIATVDGTDIHVTLPENPDTNQKVKVGDTTFGDDDTVKLEAGSNVTITGNARDQTITISATNTEYSRLDSVNLGLGLSAIDIDKAIDKYCLGGALSNYNARVIRAISEETEVIPYMVSDYDFLRYANENTDTPHIFGIESDKNGRLYVTIPDMSVAYNLGGSVSQDNKNAIWQLNVGSDSESAGTITLKHAPKDQDGVGSMVDFAGTSNQNTNTYDIEMSITYIDGGVF